MTAHEPHESQKHERAHAHGLRHSWPIHRRQTVELVGGWVVLTGLWILVGTLITGPLAASSIVHNDIHLAHWMVDHRTPRWNHLTVWGSMLAETLPKVVVTLVLALVFLRLWHRWFEAVYICVALAVEAAAFITVTTVVGRHRPDVPRLDGSPVGSSFPSGHTAAAVAYAAIVVVVFWHTRKVWVRALLAVLTVVVPVIVALSRMYRGMHFLTDTLFGGLLGAAAVVLTTVVLTRSPEGRAAIDRRAETAEAGSVALGSPDGERVVV